MGTRRSFGRLVVYDDRITGAEVAEPFATLADPQLPERLGGKAGVGSAISSGPGSSEGVLVGVQLLAGSGMDPGTPFSVAGAQLREAI